MIRRVLDILSVCLILGLLHTGHSMAQSTQSVEAAELHRLLPNEVAGWLAISRRTTDQPATVTGVYGKGSESPTVGVVLGYGPEARSRLDEMITELADPAAERELEHAGRTVRFVHNEPEGRAAVVMATRQAGAGLSMDCSSTASCPAVDSVRTLLLTFLDAVDPDRLAAFPSEEAIPTGFVRYTASLPGMQIGFEVPDGWTVRNFYETTARGAPLVVVQSDPRTADELYSPTDSEGSVEDTVDLGTAENAGVDFVAVGEDLDRSMIRDLVEGMASHIQLVDSRVTEPVAETTLNGMPGFGFRYRGKDIAGRPAVGQVVYVLADSVGLAISALWPADAPDELHDAVNRMIHSLDVTPDPEGGG